MSNSNSNQIRWQPPAHGRVKCNMDAAFSEQRNSTGIGLCVRDEECTFILAKVIPVSLICSDHMGELATLFSFFLRTTYDSYQKPKCTKNIFFDKFLPKASVLNYSHFSFLLGNVTLVISHILRSVIDFI